MAQRSDEIRRDIERTRGELGDTVEALTQKADVKTQDKYGVKYLKYWVDEKAGKVFCLVDAPSPEAAAKVHKEAHGLVADEIYPVSEGS